MVQRDADRFLAFMKSARTHAEQIVAREYKDRGDLVPPCADDDDCHMGLDADGNWIRIRSNGSIATPRSAEREEYLRRVSSVCNLEIGRTIGVTIERIADPQQPAATPASVLFDPNKNGFLRWLNGDNPQYAPTYAELIIGNAFAERKRSGREQAEFTPKGEAQQAQHNAIFPKGRVGIRQDDQDIAGLIHDEISNDKRIDIVRRYFCTNPKCETLSKEANHRIYALQAKGRIVLPQKRNKRNGRPK